MAKISKNVLIPVVGLIAFAAVAAASYFYLPAKMGTMKSDDAVKKAVDFVNANMLAEGIKAEYKDIKDSNGLYTFKLAIQGQEYNAYVTKDGKLMFADGISQAIDLDQQVGEKAKPAEITKTDKPDVKVFVMSYCPFGLQAQKMYVPVHELLKGKATMGVYFVNYAMHGKKELDENMRQYCIQKEQGSKYDAYLKCFTVDPQGAACNTDDCTANFGKCATQAGIDTAKLNTCISNLDKEFKVTADFNDKNTWMSGTYPKFAVNNDLNEKYKVGGSPTIIINDVDVSNSISPRTPQKMKEVICSAFTTEPEECKTELSGEQPAAGFLTGGEEATGGAAGGCGG